MAGVTINTPPETPSLDLPTDETVNQSVRPVFKTTATDPDGDTLKYKIVLCTDAAMTVDCQAFDQTSDQTGWSTTSYASGTQAVYSAQADLTPGTTYYWKSYALDYAVSTVWSNTQTTPYSFTTIIPPIPPAQCANLVKNDTNTAITLHWSDILTNEDGYQIDRNVDGAGFTSLTFAAANATQYTDTITNGHTYAYRIRSRITDSESNYVYSTDACTTSTLDLKSGNMGVSGLRLNGIQVK